MLKYLFLISIPLLTACSSGGYDSQSNQNINYQIPTSYKVYQNNYFKVNLPSNWIVTSMEGPDKPTHITMTNIYDETIVTISVVNYFRSMDETCRLSTSNLVDNKNNITKGPVIEKDTCKIKAFENGKEHGMLLRVYPDQSFYSIHYEGDPVKVFTDIIHNTTGKDYKMQALLKSI